MKNVNIGLRVRKTADKSTVKFDNEPFTGAKLLQYDRQGFKIGHESLPKDIWVDFEQLPLTKLKIDNGIIQDEITFVERLMGGGGTTSMFLMPTHWLDYQELLHDKQLKDSEVKYTISQLNEGDNVISALCREGNVMTYLGKFFVVYTKDYQRWGYHDRRKFPYISNAPERAFFAIRKDNGKIKIVNYPITNKKITELYKAEDRGLEACDVEFTSMSVNLDMIRYVNHNRKNAKYYSGYEFTEEAIERLTNYDKVTEGAERAIFITDFKKDFKTRAMEYYATNLKQLTETLFETEQLAQDEYSRKNRY